MPPFAAEGRAGQNQAKVSLQLLSKSKTDRIFYTLLLLFNLLGAQLQHNNEC